MRLRRNHVRVGFGGVAALLLLLTACERVPSPYGVENAMVVSADSLASELGASIMRSGGNAVDAAVAVGFALAVTYPEAGNIGGGGFMTLWIPDSGGFTVDFRERAPMASTPGMFHPDPKSSVDGCLAAGVPGTVAGLLLALERFGTLPLPVVLQPSIDLARGGIRVDRRMHDMLELYRPSLEKYPSTTRIFFRDGDPLKEGMMLVQDDLATTLERIRDKGREGFYEGRTAELIVEQMAGGRGIMTKEDLSAYCPSVQPPLTGSYRGHEIITMGLPSSGGICLLKMFSLLEPHDLGDYGHNSPRSVHLVAEAMKRSFAMRAGYLGDPDFNMINVGDLLSGPDGGASPLQIREDAATPADSLGSYPFLQREGSETTHFSVIDAEGMAVAVTYTLNDLFGNKVVVEGGGFFLNDEMDDFVTIPGEPNLYGLVGGAENMVEPWKRPLSSMSPTIVLRDGKPLLLLGARGGSRIISGVLQTIINVIDFGMSAEHAVEAPRFHHQWSPDSLDYETDALGPAALSVLTGKGHNPRAFGKTVGKLAVIFVDPVSGRYYGAPDPREKGTAAGY